VDCPSVVVCGVCEVCDIRTSGIRSVVANQENRIIRLIIWSILSGNLLQAAKIALTNLTLIPSGTNSFFVPVIQTCAS
jgi:hypothetical protein